MQLYFIFSLIAAIFVVIFAITNATAVPVKIFFLEYNLSLSLIIFISTALGAIIATMFGLIKQFKLNKQLKKIISENQCLMMAQKRLEEELLNGTWTTDEISDANEVPDETVESDEV